MSIERRLNKLEKVSEPEGGVVVLDLMTLGLSEEEAFRERFGKAGPPKNTLVVVLRDPTREGMESGARC